MEKVIVKKAEAIPVEVRDGLLNAAAFVERVGHCQLLGEVPTGEVCVTTAIAKVTLMPLAIRKSFDDGPYQRCLRALCDYLGVAGFVDLLKWNDRPGRTVAEVAAALRGAAADSSVMAAA